MNISRTIKDLGWKVIDHLPFKMHYYVLFVKEKKRLPRLLRPKDYSDFIFQDNFFGRHNAHAFLADKYEVRNYVEERGLGDNLPKLYGVWDNADKINFDNLPNQFAIKCNHSCATNIIVFDKSTLDIVATKNQLNRWLMMRHPIFFEQHYYHIKPLIICEELIKDNADGNFPKDYKIHCVNGKPVYIQCCFERTKQNAGKRVIYSPEWKNLHFILNDDHYSDEECDKPKHLHEMLEYAPILSKGLDYARIDFYDTDEKPLFGEITLTPMGGWLSYFKQEALDLMGREIRANKERINARKYK